MGIILLIFAVGIATTLIPNTILAPEWKKLVYGVCVAMICLYILAGFAPGTWRDSFNWGWSRP